MRAADRAIEMADWEKAISRAYYAVYHAVVVVLETLSTVQRRPWEHVQLQNDFRTQFANRSLLFSTADARNLAGLYEARLIVDYEQQVFSRHEAAAVLSKAKGFYEKSIEVSENAQV